MTPTDNLNISLFAGYFEGSDRGYGVHIYTNETDGLKKKGKSWSEDKLVTKDLYRDHLNGVQGLGIVPVTPMGMCKFTVIDIDVYDADLSMFVRTIDKHKFPMVPFRSKSGGLHIYTFFDSFVNAEEAVNLTKELASILHIDKFVKDASNNRSHALEIFPKQTRKSGGGSWINLPYYDAMHEPIQCALKGTKDLTISEANILIKERLTDLGSLRQFINALPFNDAPPCLQTLFLLDAVEQNGGRNNYLFSWGAYFKKKDENTFEAELFQVNDAMSSPLPDAELEGTIMKSLRKKDYNYMCKQMPCVTFCDKKVCKTREYGVGKIDGFFSGIEFGQLYQFRQDKPYYEWEVRIQGEEEYKRLRFKDEIEIMKQDVFAQLCFRELHVLPMKLNQMEWYRLVNKNLETIDTIEIGSQYDTSPVNTLKEYFHEFLVGRAPAKTPTEIMTHRVFHDLKYDELWFRTNDVIDYLYSRKNFRAYQQQEITAHLRDFGCISKTIRTGGAESKSLRVYALPYTFFVENIQSVLFSEDTAENVNPEDEPEVTEDGLPSFDDAKDEEKY